MSTLGSIVVDIHPICHGAFKQESGLRLDTAAAARQGGESGPAIVSNSSGKSLLIDAVTGKLDDWRMPPEGEPLSPKQIEVLRRWIDSGARAPQVEQPMVDPRTHWSFQPPRQAAVPAIESAIESAAGSARVKLSIWNWLMWTNLANLAKRHCV